MNRWTKRLIVAVLAVALTIAGVAILIRTPAREPEPSTAVFAEEDELGPAPDPEPESISQSAPTEKPDEATAPEQRFHAEPYTVRIGDSLYSIAQSAYRGLGGTPNDHWLTIYAYNAENGRIDPRISPIVRAGDRYFVEIEVGQELLVPFYPDGFPPTDGILARYGLVVVPGAQPAKEPVAAAAEESPPPPQMNDAPPEETLPRVADQEPPSEPDDSVPTDMREPEAITPPVEERPPIEERPPEQPAETTPTVEESPPIEEQPPAVTPTVEERPPEPSPEPPPPVERRAVEQSDRPALTLSSPAPFSFYGDTLAIEGSVEAVADEATTSGVATLDSLSVYTTQHPEEREVVFWDVTTGRFRHLLSTVDLSGHQEFVVEAINSLGNVTAVSIRVYDGNTPPEITLSSPDTEYGYGAFLEIAGRGTDPTPDEGQPHGVASVRYELLPVDFTVQQETVEGEITPERDGSFSFAMPTDDLNGAQLVTLTVRGVNGAERELQFELEPADTAIPRVEASAGNGRVTIDWSALPGERRYSIWYAEATPGEAPSSELWRLPDAIELPDVEPPYRITGLTNARRYRFQVVGSAPIDRRESIGGSPEVWSTVVENVPLTGSELTPTAENDFDAIVLRWGAIRSVERYTVWRRDSSAGAYQPIATVDGLEYHDRAVRYGVRYSYRIAPDLPGAVRSGEVAGQTASVPQEAVTELAETSEGSVTSVAVAGLYVAVADEQSVAILDIWDAPPVVRRGAVPSLSGIVALASWDRYILGADRSGRIRVIDNDDPANPRLVHTGDRIGAADLAIVPTDDAPLVFAAGESLGVSIYTFEQQPIDLRPVWNDRTIRGTVLTALTDRDDPDLVHVVTTDGDEVVFLEVRNAEVVHQIGRTELPAVTDLDLIHNADGTTILLATTSSDLVVIAPEDSSGRAQRVLSRTAIAGATAVRGVSYDDGSIFGYVGGSHSGITVFDLSDPTVPVQFAGTRERRSVNELALHRAMTGEVTIVAATDEGASLYEAHTIGRSRSVATIATPGQTRRVRLADTTDGTMVVIADERGTAIHPLDETLRLRSPGVEPNRYLVTGADGSSGEVSGADILTAGRRSLLLLADREAGLLVCDLARRDGTPPIAQLSADIQPIDVLGRSFADGTALAYLLDERWGLIVVDLTEPETPRQRGSARVDEARDFVRVGDRIYIADAVRGIVTIDISNPDLPRETARLELPGARAIDVRRNADGSYTGLAATVTGVVVLSAGSSTAPMELRGSYASRFVESVWIDDRYALVSEGVLGLSVLDISNPDRPRRISGSDIAYASHAVRADSWALVTDGTDLQIVEIIVPPWLSYAIGSP